MQQIKRKKILLISSEFPPNVGGIGNHAYHLAKCLSESNYDVSVLTNHIDVDSHTLESFKKSIPFKLHSVKKSSLVALTYAKRVVLSIQLSRQADVIICSGKFSLWMVNAVQYFNSSKKIIAVLHGSELQLRSTISKHLVKHSLQKFDVLIAVSRFTKKLIPKKIVQAKNVYVIPNGIDINEFFGKAEIEKNTIKDGPINLITIGSVTPRKGQENIIDALPVMLKYFSNIHYHIVGKPVIQEQLERRVKELSLEKHVTFYGILPREVLIDFLDKMHLKMMLSNTISGEDVEGFGIAVLEANAAGLPAIGSKNTGIEDAINDHKTGILVDPENAHEIAKALKEIIANYAYYSSNAGAWAKQHDWHNLIQKYIEVIESFGKQRINPTIE